MRIAPSKYSYEESYNAFKEVMTGSESLIESIFDINRFELEAKKINEMESVIPKELRFELELSMLFDKKVTQYNKERYSGKKNLLLEHARQFKEVDQIKLQKALEKFSNKLNEAELTADIVTKAVSFAKGLEKLKSDAASKISNTTGKSTAPTDLDATSASTEPIDLDNISTSDTGGLGTGEKSLPDSEGGFFNTLKELWSSLTDGGTWQGIVHLILDVIGLVPGLGVGEIADAINGIWYLAEGKTMLAILSFISLVPFGDAVKVFKPIIKWADEIIFGGKAAVDVILKVPASQRGLFTKFFNYLKDNISKVSSVISKILTTTLRVLSKFTDWIPGLGPKLKSFFDIIISKVEKFSTSVGTKVNKSVIDVADAVSKKTIRDFSKVGEVMAAGGKVDVIKIGDIEHLSFVSSGKTITIPVEDLQKINYLKKVFPKGFEELINTKFKVGTKSGGPKIAARYLNSLAAITKETDKTVLNKIIKIGKFSFKLTKKSSIFLGKQILKLMNDGQPFTDSEDVQARAHGDIGFRSLMDERIAKDLKDHPGQTYSAPLIGDVLQDKEMFDQILDQQNYYAKKFGMPSIIPVAYYVAKNRGEDIPTEVNDFMKDAYSDSEREEMEKTIKDKMSSSKEEKSTTTSESYQFEFKPTKFKYLTPYSKF